MTEAEKRAYARGYNRGRARSHDWAIRLIELLKGYRARLTDIDAERACAACRFWSRGTGSAKWGRCAKAGDSTAWLAEPGAWPERADWRTSPEGLVILTHDHFGCVNWLPIAAASSRP